MTIKAKQLNWEGPFEPDGIHREHYCFCNVGLRDPIVIEWKGWKDYPAYTSNTPWGFVCEDSLESAKDKVHQLWNAFISNSVDELDIEQEMKNAGMIPLDEILSGESASIYSTHVGVTSIERFADWLARKREQYIRMRIKQEFEKNDGLYDFILGKASAYDEIWLNFKKGTK